VERQFVRAPASPFAADLPSGRRTNELGEPLRGLTWKLGLATSLLSLPVLAPFCARDTCYDRGGAVDSSGTKCQLGRGQVEPLGTWSWTPQAWVYFLVVGSLPGLAAGVLVSLLRGRLPRRAA
jgi:hypothetical protein